MLNAQRLEEGWFILKLCQFHQSRGDYSRNFHTELVNGRKDIEQLCKAAYEVFSTEVPQWIHHKCSVTGCSTGYETLDGNEKLTRTMCSAPHCKVYIRSGGVSVISCCRNTPALGGNNVKGYKYCPSHQNHEDTQSLGDGRPLDMTQTMHTSKHSEHTIYMRQIYRQVKVTMGAESLRTSASTTTVQLA